MEIIIEDYRAALLDLVGEYCRLSGRQREYVAGKVVKDRRFFDNLEAGAGCTCETYLKLQNWLKANTPKPKRKISQQKLNAKVNTVSA